MQINGESRSSMCALDGTTGYYRRYVYGGGVVSGLTILELSEGCDWYIADASEIGMMQSAFD